MKRVGFLLKVKQEKIAEYRARHQVVWPEMLDALRRAGWHNYSLFMRPDGMLFGYVEVDESFTQAQANMAHEEANERWQTFMDGFFEIPPGFHADQAMQELDEVFHLD
ncbi:MAG TPA: L-rhamnose mutarotase [Ktedonobacterales bacterium]|nr:L-rhamnose mutarotase [Ktedonobacterales bacterium]